MVDGNVASRLVLKERLGEGTQSEVLLGELPEVGAVAVKLGLKQGAIAREAAVLSTMSAFPGFPTMLHHDEPGPTAPGGFLIVQLLGSSLEDLWGSKSGRLSAPTLLKVGRGMLRLIRELHTNGFVHNDIKPANILLDAGEASVPTRLHLIDFGSCTRANALDDEAEAEAAGPLRRANGPIGTAMFASISADDAHSRMRPVDDIESLTYNLLYLATGSLPWKGKKPDSLATSIKQEMLTSRDAVAQLTDAVPCATSAAALCALWDEVRRCPADGASIDYDACMDALGGGAWTGAAAEADALSEAAFLAGIIPSVTSWYDSGVRLDACVLPAKTVDNVHYQDKLITKPVGKVVPTADLMKKAGLR